MLNYHETLRELAEKPGLVLQVFDDLPIPIEIFAPDGSSVFINRAFMELNNIKDASLVSKYNLLKDPVCLEILGQDVLDRIFAGEPAVFRDFPAPIQDLVDRSVIIEKPWEASVMDLDIRPVWDGDKFVCTVCYFKVKNIYKGRAAVAKAQEYIELHWLEDFDLDKVAESVSLSRRHFGRLFKEATGLTPLDFYHHIKIEKLKEKLLAPGLSVEQAFTDCGVNSHGAYLKLFETMVGKTPTEYRAEKRKAK